MLYRWGMMMAHRWYAWSHSASSKLMHPTSHWSTVQAKGADMMDHPFKSDQSGPWCPAPCRSVGVSQSDFSQSHQEMSTNLVKHRFSLLKLSLILWLMYCISAWGCLSFPRVASDRFYSLSLAEIVWWKTSLERCMRIDQTISVYHFQKILLWLISLKNILFTRTKRYHSFLLSGDPGGNMFEPTLASLHGFWLPETLVASQVPKSARYCGERVRAPERVHGDWRAATGERWFTTWWVMIIRVYPIYQPFIGNARTRRAIHRHQPGLTWTCLDAVPGSLGMSAFSLSQVEPDAASFRLRMLFTFRLAATNIWYKYVAPIHESLRNQKRWENQRDKAGP